MTSSSTTSDSGLSARMADGDEQALAVMFSRHRDKLWRMVHFRLDPRLASRMDADDVLQEAWLAALRRLNNFREQDSMSAFLWVRLIVGQSMIDLYRAHLGAAVRSAGREVPIFNGTPAASSLCLSAHLLASLLNPDAGEVLVGGLDVHDSTTPRHRARRSCAEAPRSHGRAEARALLRARLHRPHTRPRGAPRDHPPWLPRWTR